VEWRYMDGGRSGGQERTPRAAAPVPHGPAPDAPELETGGRSYLRTSHMYLRASHMHLLLQPHHHHHHHHVHHRTKCKSQHIVVIIMESTTIT
jgi:hypothetical protein